MNFSLPKLSAVALLSLAAGFGASMWLNATEPEGPGTPPDLCTYQYNYTNNNLRLWLAASANWANPADKPPAPKKNYDLIEKECGDLCGPTLPSCPARLAKSFFVPESPGKPGDFVQINSKIPVVGCGPCAPASRTF